MQTFKPTWKPEVKKTTETFKSRHDECRFPVGAEQMRKFNSKSRGDEKQKQVLDLEKELANDNIICGICHVPGCMIGPFETRNGSRRFSGKEVNEARNRAAEAQAQEEKKEKFTHSCATCQRQGRIDNLCLPVPLPK